MTTEERRAQNRKADQKRRMGGTVAKLAEQVQEAADLPEPPTREALIRVLGVQAMNGHVTAIRLLLEEYREKPKTGPLDELDELAERRRTGP